MTSVAVRMNDIVWIVAVLLVACLAGCGTAGLAPVEGRVTVDGQPAPEGITIEFAPVQQGELGISIATVGADGQYVARNPATGENGVPIGPCVARLYEDEKTTIMPQKPGQSPKPKYNPQAAKEILKFDVKPGKNTVDLELHAAGK